MWFARPELTGGAHRRVQMHIIYSAPFVDTPMYILTLLRGGGVNGVY